MHGGREGAFVGLEALRHGLVLGPCGKLDVVQLGTVGRQVVQAEVLLPQARLGLPCLYRALDGGIVQDHHTRDAAVRLGQGGVAGTGSVSGAAMAAITFTRCLWRAFVGDFGPSSAPASGVGAEQAGAEARLVEEEEVRLPVTGLPIGSRTG